MYLLDQPRRGNAGQSTVAHAIPATPDDQIWYGMFRFGVWPNYFPGVQLSRDPEALNQFFRSMTPNTGPYDAKVNTEAVSALFDQIGPGTLVTHSQGGGPGWLVAMKNPNVHAVATYEPGSGFVFPEGEVRRVSTLAVTAMLTVLPTACASKFYSPVPPTAAQLPCSSGEVPVAQRFYQDRFEWRCGAPPPCVDSEHVEWRPVPGSEDRHGVANARAVCVSSAPAALANKAAPPAPQPRATTPAVTPAKDAEVNAVTAPSLSPLEQAKAWWTNCLKQTVTMSYHPYRRTCEEDTAGSGCWQTCASDVKPRLDQGHFAELDLDACRTIRDASQYVTKCQPVVDYVEGRITDTLSFPKHTRGDVTIPSDKLEIDVGRVGYRLVEPIRSHKYQARLAMIEARCSLIMDGSVSCNELINVGNAGGWGNCGPIPISCSRTSEYALSQAERDTARSIVQQVWPKLDEARWAELTSTGALAQCQKPSRSTDCEPIGTYLKSFTDGRHRKEAADVLKGSEQRRQQLATQETRQAMKEAEARDRYWQSTEGQSKIQQCNVCKGQCKANGSADYECDSRCSSLCPWNMPR